MSTVRRPLLSLRLHCLLALLVVVLPAHGQAPGPFEGVTEVAGQGAEEREAALPRALAQLLVKLTGDPEVAADPALADALARAPALMQHYRYRMEGGRALRLIARFDRPAVEAMLADAGRPVWQEPRPVPVLWLAIDDGRGARLVGSPQAAAIAALTERGQLRGLSFGFPLLDLEDQQRVDAARVWNNDLAALAAATARYGGTALVGRLHRAGGGWRADWSVLAGSTVIEQQQVADGDAGVLLAAGADLAANALARHELAQAFDAGPPGSYRIWIEGIRTGDDYARALNYLQRMAVVLGLQPLRAEDDRLLLQLDLASGLEGLARRIAADDVLVALEPAGGDERRFVLLP